VAAYVERTDAVSLILDGTPRSGGPADGPPGARDAIDADVEGLWGGDGDDTLTGNAADNLLNGGPGGDVLGGGPGTDAADYSDRSQPVDVTIDGQSGSGGAADGHRDTVLTDVEDVIGGTAADRLSGSPAVNLLLGLGGDDTLTTRDDVSDTPECGAGNDTAVVDRFDEPEECEDVQLPVTPRATPTPTPTATPVTTPTPTTTPTVPAARVALARGQTLAGALRRGLRTQVTCGAACTVDQRLVIARSTARRLGLPAKRPLTIARATATAKGPTTLKLTLRVEARVARRLRSARSLTATLATTVRMPGARTPQLSTTVRLSGRRTAQADRLLAMRDASRAWTRRAERR
jgi:hypothetical protein